MASEVVLCLGRLAHEAVLKSLIAAGTVGDMNIADPEALKKLEFRHGGCTRVAPNLFLLDTYHPSRQNTNTGRLTEPMLDAVMSRARSLLEC